MSLADQVTATYVVVAIVVGLGSWLTTTSRGTGVLLLSLTVALAGAFGVEALLAELLGIYSTFGSLDTLIQTSVVKSAAGAILSVGLLRLAMRLVRPKRASR